MEYILHRAGRKFSSKCFSTEGCLRTGRIALIRLRARDDRHFSVPEGRFLKQWKISVTYFLSPGRSCLGMVSYNLFLDRVLNSLSCKQRLGKRKCCELSHEKNRYQTSKKNKKLIDKKKLERKLFTLMTCIYRNKHINCPTR